MNSQQRHELLQLVDALCEGIATQHQCARLEELVLGHEGARQLYVQALALHGSLHWDAAGIGNQSDVLDIELREVLAIPRRRKQGRQAYWAWAISAAACVLVAIVTWMGTQGNTTQFAGTPTGTLPAHEPVEPDHVRPDIPHLTLGVNHGRLIDGPNLIANSPIEPGQIELPEESLVSLIDLQLASAWKENGVIPNSVAEDSEWMRRVYLDLAGRIPTAAEAERYLHDTSPQRREHLVSSLLDGQEFPAHFSMVWTNLLVGRTPQEEINRPALEQYLANQFAANRPWSETVSDLITAEGSGDENGAANFLLAHLNNEAVPATAITARVLLGQQMQCTQCHQHPAVAAWGQEQFWEVNACFQQTRIEQRLVVDQETGEKKTVRELIDKPGSAGSYYETLKGVMKVAYPGFRGQEIPLSPETNRRQELAKLMLSGDRTDVAREFVNRTWAHFFGEGFTNPVDDLGPHNPVSHPYLLEELTRHFVASDYNVRELIEAICQSQAYQLSSALPAGEAVDDPEHGAQPLFSRVYVKPLSPEQMFQSLLVASGVSPAELRRAGRQRNEWISQFFKPEETEENGESTTFDGSLRQALSLMNGELVSNTVRSDDNFVTKLVDTSASDVEKIRQLSLITLSRYPTSDELNSIRQVLRSYVRQRTDHNVPPRIAASEGFRDLYWAYLNSSEFSVNH